MEPHQRPVPDVSRPLTVRSLTHPSLPEPDQAMRNLIPVLLLGAVVAACGPDDPPLDDRPPETAPPVGEVATPADTAPLLDAETRRTLADRIDESSRHLQEHTRGLRIVPPAQVPEHLSLHRERVEDLAGAVAIALSATREAAESEEEAAAALGLERGRHRALGREISDIRAELQAMERADQNRLTELLPGHFERLDRFSATAESIAAHLRRGHPRS